MTRGEDRKGKLGFLVSQTKGNYPLCIQALIESMSFKKKLTYVRMQFLAKLRTAEMNPRYNWTEFFVSEDQRRAGPLQNHQVQYLIHGSNP